MGQHQVSMAIHITVTFNPSHENEQPIAYELKWNSNSDRHETSSALPQHYLPHLGSPAYELSLTPRQTYGNSGNSHELFGSSIMYIRGHMDPKIYKASRSQWPTHRMTRLKYKLDQNHKKIHEEINLSLNVRKGLGPVSPVHIS